MKFTSIDQWKSKIRQLAKQNNVDVQDMQQRYILEEFAVSPPVVGVDASAVSMIWSHITEIIFLVGTIKMSDHVVKDMMGL